VAGLPAVAAPRKLALCQLAFLLVAQEQMQVVIMVPPAVAVMAPLQWKMLLKEQSEQWYSAFVLVWQVATLTDEIHILSRSSMKEHKQSQFFTYRTVYLLFHITTHCC
jgi:hypothetical protein